ncbi:hypothetical protein VaNZ11_007508, partial [Volvox africanus]
WMTPVGLCQNVLQAIPVHSLHAICILEETVRQTATKMVGSGLKWNTIRLQGLATVTDLLAFYLHEWLVQGGQVTTSPTGKVPLSDQGLKLLGVAVRARLALAAGKSYKVV